MFIPVVADLLVGGPVVFPSLGTSETVYVIFGFKPGITISVGRSVIGISCRKNYQKHVENKSKKIKTFNYIIKKQHLCKTNVAV